jgi:AcrR family transcriptional regulator
MLLVSTPRRRSTSGSSEPAATYHHGNLRQALLEAARALTAEVGIEGFTLREIARRAGVSHAAPYNHFTDKADLERALAIEAFKDLADTLHRAASSADDPISSLEAVGVAYVRFALQHPNEFRFIFRSDLRGDDATQSPVNAAGERAYAVLLEAVRACKRAGLLSDTDLETQALTAWSTSHGLATLLLNAPRQNMPQDEGAVETVTLAVLRTLQNGLFRR